MLNVYYQICKSIANLITWVVFIIFFFQTVALAATNFESAPNCENLTLQIEKKYNLPKHLLASLSRVEAGRVLSNGDTRAWPWSLNHSGKGLFFESKIGALNYLKKATGAGSTNVDVGCMQLNFKWHHEAFSDLDEMIDPIENIDYAARFVLKLYKRHGSWDNAIKHYHSNKPKFNKPYFKKVAKVWSHKKNAELESNPLMFVEKAESVKVQPVKPLIPQKEVEPIVVFQATTFVESMVNDSNQAKNLNFSIANSDPIGSEIPSNVPEFLRKKWSMVLSLRPQLER